MPPTINSSNLWRPLRNTVFRNLLAADVVSDIGAFMQSVGAAWLMVSLGAGPAYIALTQTASALPFFLFALPAGSAGDIVDRRKLILSTEIWMLSVALALAVFTIVGWMTPWLLLVLTFALSAGDAFETPTWRAVLPELIAKEDLEAASALNGIEFNLARAVGPALGGLLIATVGIAAAFVANVLSFFGVILVVARWKRPVQKRTAPAETLGGATVAAIRYIRHSPKIGSLLLRTGVAMFFTSALFALLPALAHSVSKSAIGYGILLGCFGAGGVLGALLLQAARSRWSTETIVSGGVAIVGAVMATTSALHGLSTLGPIMLLGGAAWIVFISLISALIQKLAPDWVRARVLAIYLLVFQGAVALGSAMWGVIAQRAGIRTAMLCAGIGTIATLALALVAKLPDATQDLSPWNHWRMPVVVKEVGPELDRGPVLVTAEYIVIPAHRNEFLDAMHRYERIRRRDGAFRWGIYHDTEAADRYLEIFLVDSWAEHLRQHARQTQADRKVEQRVSSFIVGEPVVRHMIFAQADD
jgi:predicted MFS family arabinose efflux permease